MGTDYFLADSRYMAPAEIQLAHTFDDSALFCHKVVGPNLAGNLQSVYTLEVPRTLLFNLPPHIFLINNNNDLEVNTIGNLIAQIERRKGKIISIEEAMKLDLAQSSNVIQYLQRDTRKSYH